MCCGAWNNPKVVHRHLTCVSWLRPEEGFIKLDVNDNSLRNSTRIGFGGFLKHFKGRWLMGFTSYGGFGSFKITSN